jgi:hypothetical protein
MRVDCLRTFPEILAGTDWPPSSTTRNMVRRRASTTSTSTLSSWTATLPSHADPSQTARIVAN